MSEPGKNDGLSASELRARAEALAGEGASRVPEAVENLPADEIARILHELRVHQIELEMQNEELRRAHAELEESRSRYFDLYDLAPVGYCTVSEKGLILEANLAAAGMFGMTRSELVNHPFSRLILPEDQDIYYLRRKQLFENGGPQLCDLRMRKKGGAIFWGRLEASVAETHDGAVVCRVVMSDITGRKLQEDERELAARLIAMVNVPGDFHERMAALTASLQGWSGCAAVGIRLRDGDDYPYYETRGFPPEFVQEENHLCQYDSDGNVLRDGDGNPVLDCMCGNVLSGRVDPSKPFFTAHGSFWSNNTTELLASTAESDRSPRARNRCNGEGYESVALIPLRIGGQIFGLLQFNDRHPDRFTLELITHFEGMADSLAIALSQRQEREALMERELQYRTLADSGRALIWTSGLDRKCDYFNQPWLDFTGRSMERELGDGWTEGVHPDDLARCVGIYTAAFDQRECFSMEYRLRRHDGEFRWIQDDGTPRHDINGNFVGYIGHCLDITERIQMEEELWQSQKMESVGRLAGGVAHDFNNMLGIILGHAEMALEGLDPASPAYDSLREIAKAGQRSAVLTRQLLVFARRQTIAPVPLELNDTITGMLKMLERLIGENIAMSWMPGYELWQVRMDPGQIDQILVNLAVNARDAVGAAGKVAIKTANAEFDEAYARHHPECVPGRYVMLSVSDDGCGMDKATIERLFEPFFTTKPFGQGTGLGLSTVYGIVKQNNGFIDVRSQPGAGSVFSVYLPAHEAEPAIETKAPQDPPIPMGTETVLLVEDEQALLDFTRHQIERLGYTVLAANGPKTAIRLAADHAGGTDLMLTDVVMPGMSGRELRDRLAVVRPGIKCLFMSGYPANVLAADGALDKDTHFLQKPFTRKALAHKLREVLDRG